MADKPEQRPRRKIDQMLAEAGWVLQDRSEANITAARGVAIREFPLKPGSGFADYLLYVDGAAAGVVEAKKQGVAYSANQLDRDVVARDQIRTVARTFRDRLFAEIFPGRTEVPKTLIFAKDDSHADDIVQIVREEFGRGNDFAQDHLPGGQAGGAAARVPKQLQPAHCCDRGHDRDRHGCQATRDRDVHAGCEEPELLRAVEGPGRPGD